MHGRSTKQRRAARRRRARLALIAAIEARMLLALKDPVYGGHW